jgi:hypothetical protein
MCLGWLLLFSQHSQRCAAGQMTPLLLIRILNDPGLLLVSLFRILKPLITYFIRHVLHCLCCHAKRQRRLQPPQELTSPKAVTKGLKANSPLGGCKCVVLDSYSLMRPNAMPPPILSCRSIQRSVPPNLGTVAKMDTKNNIQQAITILA